jgi:hypothetical protein
MLAPALRDGKGGEVCHIWILALRRRLNGMICFKAGFDDRVD